MRIPLPLSIIVLLMILSWDGQAQSFPNPSTLSTGQGTPGGYDPIWTVSQWYPSSATPPNPIGLTYTQALINNNCAPGAWVDPSTLPPPANNGNWITGTNTPCANNYNDGYLYFRLTLNLPTDCNGNSVTTAGNYILYFSGYVDNQITDVFVNGASMGISGGGFSPGSQLNITLPGPWIPGTNYVDVLVYNYPNSGGLNPYGLLLVANTVASTTADGDGDGIPDITDQCPCSVGPAPSGCPQAAITGNQTICQGGSTTLTATGGGTYLWSNSSTNASITVSPTSTTPYSVTTTSSTGYTSSAAVNVAVNLLPIPSISPTASAAVCTGQSTTLTASGGTSYLWSTTAVTAAITVSPTIPTTYAVTVTDANTCSATASKTVSVNPLPAATISPTTATICAGNSATLTAGGGNSYKWSTTDITAPVTVSPATTTTYSVTVTDANSCSTVITRTVNVNQLPIPAISPATATICAGNSATLTASGGISYLWNTTATTAPLTVSPTITTTYSITVTDANTCSATTSRSVTVNQLPIPAISPATSTICAGNSATLTASGGTSYLWNTTAITAPLTVSPTITTTYSVTVTDANTCSATTSRSVTVNQLPIPAISPANPAICVGNSTTLTASGGTSYLWNTTATTAPLTVSPTTTTTYSVTVTDANTCSATASKSVTVNQLPIPAISPASPAICMGNSATLTASGGTNYLWNTTATTAPLTVSPTTTTTYSVTVTDANTCSATTSRSVTVNQLPIAAIAPSTLSICIGDNATLSASGGITYLWNTTSTTASITVAPTATTTYSVTATDANLCSAATSRTVTVNFQPIPAINPSSVSICTGSSATLTASGGISYVWSNTNTTASTTVSPTNTTTYSVNVTDANNCTAVTTTTVTVNQLPSPSITSTTSAICIGTSTILTASGGTNYLWSNTDITAATTVSPTTTTTYSVTVTDANNCSAATSTAMIVNSLPIPVINPAAPAICIGTSTTLTASGGTSYLWSTTDNAPSTTVSPTITTTYTVTATDANNCSASTSTSVAVNQLPTAGVTPSSTDICIGSSTTLTASGGTSYLWIDNSTTNFISASPTTSTTYSVVVTDANNCTAAASGTVNVNPLPIPVITPSAPQICNGNSATLTASGGTSYVWDNSSTASVATISPTTNTSYSVTATDVNNCSASTSWTMTVIPTMALTAAKTDILCYGSATGSIDLTVNSGQSPYTYLWNIGGTVEDPSGLGVGSYSVVVTDNAGCTATMNTSISEPQALSVTPAIINPSCSTLANDGSISLTVTGGVGSYAYIWSDNSSTPSLQTLAPGDYLVTVSDQNNCTASTTVTLAYTYDFTIHATPAVTINLSENTTIGYTITGNSGTITSTWSPSYALSCTDCEAPVASPNVSTLYQITVKNDAGCTATDTTSVYVVPNYNIFIPNAFTPNGDGNNDLFQIYGNLKALKFLEVNIFNRWGETVYRSNDIDFTWDGTYKGVPLEPGSLVWDMKLTFIDGHTDATQKGSLTILR